MVSTNLGYFVLGNGKQVYWVIGSTFKFSAARPYTKTQRTHWQNGNIFHVSVDNSKTEEIENVTGIC